jgi:anti-sigma factor RsiW
MSRGIKDRVEHLLDEPRGDAPDRVDARLSATFAQALQEASRTGASHDDAATMAAFLDGRLDDAELAEVRAAMARDPSLRADLEAAGALIDSASDAPASMPADLLARAQAEFAPDAPRPQPSVRKRLALLWPRQTGAWAFAAALLAIAVISPVILKFEGVRGTDIGQEQPSAGPASDLNVDVPQPGPGCENEVDQKPKTEPTAGPADQPKQPSKDPEPCPRSPADSSSGPN